MHAFSLTMKEWPRSITKQQYKAAARWLREVRNTIEPEVVSKVEETMHNLLFYGQDPPPKK